MRLPFEVRRARRDDVPRVVALLADDALGATRESAAPTPDDLQRYLAAFEAIDADPHQELVVAVVDDEIIGTLQLSLLRYLTYRGGLRAQIEAVRVSAARRGSGFGRELIGWAVERARERGCHLVQLTSDRQRPAAICFYEKLGFRATHEGLKLHLG